MSDTNNAADDLGLDALLGGTDNLSTGAVAAETASGADTTGEGNEASSTSAEAPVKQTREQVKIADLVFETFDLVPAQKRFTGGNGGESKYDFDGLAAPVANAANASGWDFAAFTVFPEDAQNFDADKLKRSVQSAAAQANREAKEQNGPERFVTRSVIKDGAYVGHRVFRVDAATVNGKAVYEERADKAE